MSTIALDVRFKVMSGAGIALMHLARHIANGKPDRMRLIVIRYSAQSMPDELRDFPSIVVPAMPSPVELIWNEVVLPSRLFQHGVDLYHGMKQCAPVHLPCRSVHTVDAIKRGGADDLPIPLIEKLYWGLIACRSYRRSDHLLPVSDHVRDFLVDELRIESSRMTVVKNGVDERFFQPNDQPPDEKVLASLPDQPFMVCVGSVIPLKNQAVAVQALGRIADRVPHHLVLLGQARGEYAVHVRRLAEDMGIGDRVHLLGFVGLGGLLTCMRRAEAMVHVSRTEGYSLATGEALACGLPMILTDRGGLREQCGDAAVYLDNPDDVQGLSALMLELLGDAHLRDTLSRRARERAQGMTWEAAAQQTIRAYQSVLGNG